LILKNNCKKISADYADYADLKTKSKRWLKAKTKNYLSADYADYAELKTEYPISNTE